MAGWTLRAGHTREVRRGRERGRERLSERVLMNMSDSTGAGRARGCTGSGREQEAARETGAKRDSKSGRGQMDNGIDQLARRSQVRDRPPGETGSHATQYGAGDEELLAEPGGSFLKGGAGNKAVPTGQPGLVTPLSLRPFRPLRDMGAHGHRYACHACLAAC